MLMDFDISIVIPAYNEESYIGCLLESIRDSKIALKYEIIVVDNGSTDNTSKIAQEYGARVISIPRNTVSRARNVGAQKAGAAVIAFFDADVRITEKWGKEIVDCIDSVKNKNIITGSRYVIPENPTWIEKYWFAPLSMKKVSYINGGNLVLSKRTFTQIEGFNEALITAEDYEFSMRAVKKSVKIINNSNLEAIHDGYPNDIAGFCKREFWHGKGDCQSIKLFLNSNVSMMAVIFGSLNVAVIISFILGNYILSLVLLACVVCLCLLMAVNIFSLRDVGLVLRNLPLCYCYLIARFLSFFAVLSGRA